ncbi:MAG: hypothetical protein KGH57_02410 [Candidatus Micrarchaeota archaeon]|nr:hypothetical protein [Candidatus Micrarchaeota archaeon]
MENQTKQTLLQRYQSDEKEKRMFETFMHINARGYFRALVDYRNKYEKAAERANRNLPTNFPSRNVLNHIPGIAGRSVGLKEVDEGLEQMLHAALKTRTLRLEKFRDTLEPQAVKPLVRR